MSFVAVLPSIHSLYILAGLLTGIAVITWAYSKTHSKVQFACVVVTAFNAGFMAHTLWLAAL